MATWKEVKDFLRDNFKVRTETGDLLELLFEFPNDRSQLLCVKRLKTPDTGIWVNMMSPVGIIEQEEINDALDFVWDHTACGGLVKIGNTHFVRHSMSVENVSSNELAVSMRFIAFTADQLEKLFIGGDKSYGEYHVF